MAVSPAGIFTSTSGSAPNRIFNIEWRTTYYGGTAPLNYEVRLYEGLTEFDVVYGTVNTLTSPNDSALSAGVQKSTTQFTLVGCDPTGGEAPPVITGQLYHYTLGAGCPSPTPVIVPTPTPSITPTPTPTPTPSPGACFWTPAPVIPALILDEAVTSVGGNLYVFGGVQGGAIAAASFKFDGTTWTSIAPLPSPAPSGTAGLEYASAVTDGTNIYILGGALARHGRTRKRLSTGIMSGQTPIRR